MIHRDDPYGWGISRLPMAREIETDLPAASSGHPLCDTGRDIPWRLMGFSLFLALLSLAGIILLGTFFSVPLMQPPPPVEIAVRMLAEAPEPVAEPVPVRLSRPEIEKSAPKVARKAPEPMVPPTPAPPRERAEPLIPALQAEEGRREPSEPRLPARTAEIGKSRPATLPEPEEPVRERSPEAATLPESTVSVGTYSWSEVPSLPAAPVAERRGSPAARRDSLHSASLPPARDFRGGGAVGLPEPGEISRTDRRKTYRSQLPPGTGKASLHGPRVAAVNLPGPGGERALTQIASTSSGLSPPSVEHLDRLGEGELDPDVAMSLSQLQTCRDPEREMILKSRLAAMINGTDRCRSGGVIFEIRNAESAYSTHVDIYNYERREFKDRCAALWVAVNACGARR